MQEEAAKPAKAPASSAPPKPSPSSPKPADKPKPDKPKPVAPAVDPAARFPIMPDLSETEEHDPHMASRWVGSLLFGILLAIGIVTLIYLFGRPFLPAEWFNAAAAR